MQIETRWSGRTVDGLHYLQVLVAGKWRPLGVFCRAPKRLTAHEKRRVIQLITDYHLRDTGGGEKESTALQDAEVLQPSIGGK